MNFHSRQEILCTHVFLSEMRQSITEGAFDTNISTKVRKIICHISVWYGLLICDKFYRKIKTKKG